MDLYDYQQQAIADVCAALDAHGRVVLQMPTGSGKTITAAEFVRQQSADATIWFLCHRREIIRQTSRAFRRAGIAFGVIAPDEPTTADRVQIASVQTLVGRADAYAAPDIIVWDECHHVAAKTWAGLMERYPSARQVGLTATPERLDGKGLAKWFPAMVRGPSIRSLIERKRLSPYRLFAPTVPDLAAARVKLGDYLQADADKVMNTPVIIGDAVEHYQRIAPGSRALVFATSLAASRAIAERFNAEGIEAAHVDGGTADDVRDAAVANLGAGAIKVLSSFGVFTEGVDVPEVDAIILLRPTRSLQLYLQMIGRGLRYAPGKVLTIIDHAGLVYEHGLPDADWQWSLDGGARRARVAAFRAGGERVRKCSACKHVHAPAPTCAECGYRYPEGREVAQFDGLLRELIGGAAAGQERLCDFARRYSVTAPAVRAWIKRGMPQDHPYIPIAAADEWVRKNVSQSTLKQRQEQLSVPKGCELQKIFAARYGLSVSSINRWVKQGLPANGTFVISAEADDWVKANVNLQSSRLRSSSYRNPEGFESIKAFAVRHGASAGTGQSWVRCGLPLTESGVPIVEGDDWVRRHKFENRKRASKIAEPGTIGRTEFAAIAHIGVSVVAQWERRGMPVTANGRIDLEAVKEWASKSSMGGQVFPFWASNPADYESRSRFADRVGTSKNTVTHWAERGLPCLPGNGWVHIRQGLEWVTANRHHNAKFEIPADAWPQPYREAAE